MNNKKLKIDKHIYKAILLIILITFLSIYLSKKNKIQVKAKIKNTNNNEFIKN